MIENLSLKKITVTLTVEFTGVVCITIALSAGLVFRIKLNHVINTQKW